MCRARRKSRPCEAGGGVGGDTSPALGRGGGGAGGTCRGSHPWCVGLAVRACRTQTVGVHVFLVAGHRVPSDERAGAGTSTLLSQPRKYRLALSMRLPTAAGVCRPQPRSLHLVRPTVVSGHRCACAAQRPVALHYGPAVRPPSHGHQPAVLGRPHGVPQVPLQAALPKLRHARNALRERHLPHGHGDAHAHVAEPPQARQ